MHTTGSKRASRVIAWLRDNVTSGTWPVGTKIPTEPELSATLNVGRSTIREAVRSLASLGILETAPGRGTFVRSTSPVSAVLTDYLGEKAIEDVLSIRRTLEIEAARKAALDLSDQHLKQLREAIEQERADVERDAEVMEPPGPFHLALVEASGNPLLTELYNGLAHAVKAGIRDGRVQSSSPEEKLADHERIYAAIVKHDLVEAVHAANDHGDRDLIIVAGAPHEHASAPTIPTVEQPTEQSKITYRRVATKRPENRDAVRVFRVEHDDS